MSTFIDRRRPADATLIELAKTKTPFEISKAYSVTVKTAEGWLWSLGFRPATKGVTWQRTARSAPPAPAQKKIKGHRTPCTLPTCFMQSAYLADPETHKRKAVEFMQW